MRNNIVKNQLEIKLLTAKLSQLGFADLEALKRLKAQEVAELVQRETDPENKQDFLDELNQFNPIIDQVIARKISEIEYDNLYSH